MEHIPCNLCGSDDPKLLFSKWNLPIIRCRKCGLCYVSPRNFAVEADDYFRGAYLSTIEEAGKLNSGISQIYAQILQQLSAYLNPGRLLDVGCAMGHFLREARDRGWNVSGTECSPYAAAYGRQEFGLDVFTACDLRDARFPHSTFDAAVLVEVAEHLPDPKSTFTEIFRVLKPGGALYVTTPNFGSFRALLRKEDWNAVIPTGHLYYFSASTLSALLGSIGFADIRDLTPPAVLSTELHLATEEKMLRAGAQEIADIFETTSLEDSGKLSNGRGEGLILWAVKPISAASGARANLRGQSIRSSLEGKLITASAENPEDQRVFYVYNGLKHWVTTSEWLGRHNLQLTDTVQVPSESLQGLLTGPPLN